MRLAGALALLLPRKPLNALFFRNETGQGSFPRVVSLPTSLRPDGTCAAQIAQGSYANLFPGFFVVGLRNLRANPTMRLLRLDVIVQ
jgi:hypothetical protein